MNGLRTPLVSVLTPSFNQGRWLQDTITSVANQTYPELEHIVVDGGSSDSSLGLLRAASSRVTWISEADNGQSDALNKAFAMSHGDIIGWLNSDDAYFATDAVAAAVEAFERNPDAEVVYGHAVLAGADGQILQILYAPKHREALLRRHNYIVQPTVFLRRRVIEEAFVDPEFHYMMDRELWLRLVACHRFIRLDRIVAIDRHHEARKSYTRLDIAAADERNLRLRYGLPTGRFSRVRRRLRKIGYRLLATRLLREANMSCLAFDGRRDGFVPLLVRQLVIPRSRMSRLSGSRISPGAPPASEAEGTG